MGERDSSGPGHRLGRTDYDPAFDFGRGAPDVQTTRGQVDVLDAKADEFRPSQAGVGEDDHDVALVAACGSELLDLLNAQVAVTFTLGDASRRDAQGRVAVNAAVLVGNIENRTQESQRGNLRPRSDQQAVDECLNLCAGEFVDGHHYEAVFEAVKGLGARLREKSGLDEDGRALVQAALGGKSPRVLLTACTTVTERNEQQGVALLAEGIFAAFRNPAAHEPRLVWEVSEQDALEVLGTLSMIHRRLDAARTDAAR